MIFEGSRTRRISVIALLTALNLSTDYAMFPLFNVKLMDSIVFFAGLMFGLEVGLSVGALTWLVYGTINPLGSAPGGLLIFLMLSEMIYAVFGWLTARWLDFSGYRIPERCLLFGFLGFIGAFLYDLNTIVTYAVFLGTSLPAALLLLFPAVPFMIAHEASDFAFFATVVPALYRVISKSPPLKVFDQRFSMRQE